MKVQWMGHVMSIGRNIIHRQILGSKNGEGRKEKIQRID